MAKVTLFAVNPQTRRITINGTLPTIPVQVMEKYKAGGTIANAMGMSINVGGNREKCIKTTRYAETFINSNCSSIPSHERTSAARPRRKP
jgi:hypothetical protein